MRSDVKVMQTFIDTMVGIPKFSYPARQNDATIPEGEFAHIRLIEEYPVGIPNHILKESDDTTATYTIISPVRLRFRIGIIESTGLAASKVMHGWTSHTMRQAMIDSGYGFIKCDPLSNEDTKQEGYWEFRQGFSIELYSTRTYEEVVDLITSMTIESKIVDEKLNTFTSTYEINED